LRPPAENIGLPDSLLSRFDLLFITLDTASQERDFSVAKHVLRMHQWRSTVEYDDEEEASDDERDLEETIFEKNAKTLFKTEGNIISLGFLRKYINYVRETVHPTLSQAACSVIASTYSELRNETQAEYRSLPVTARTLETLIRLATAYAKARLAKEVTKVSVNE